MVTPLVPGAISQNSEETVSKDRRLENLKPFRKGRSGNPGSRPKRKMFSDWARRIGDEPAHVGTDKTNAEMVVRQVYNQAKAGDIQAAKLLWLYIEGLPTQRVEFDYKQNIREFAAKYDLDADEMIAEAEHLLALATEGEQE